MSVNKIKTEIACREFQLNNGGKVVVRLGAPSKFEDGEGYFCTVHIVGLKKEKKIDVGGVDAFQAIELAFDTIGLFLYESEEGKNGSIEWNGKPDLGFPRP